MGSAPTYVGSPISIANLGIWAFAALTSNTLGEAIALLMRMLPLTPTFFRIEIHPGPARLTITFHDDRLPDDLRDLITERDTAAIATFVKTICEEHPPPPSERDCRPPRRQRSSHCSDRKCSSSTDASATSSRSIRRSSPTRAPKPRKTLAAPANSNA